MIILERVTPESVGVSSDSIRGFFDKIERFKMNINSFAFVKNGQVISEAYAKPVFNENFRHRMYSCSKSLVSLAIGKLVDNCKIKLSDRICDFFPEFTDENTDEFIRQTTVEDILKMSVPHATDSYLLRTDLPWAESFFKVKGVKPSGTVFDYNSSGTFVLCVLIEKLTGKTFIEYLRPEFDEIGVSKEITCVLSPDGHAWGSSGVICTMRDFIRICLLVLNKGEHNGKQLISKEYITLATEKRIDNFTENRYSPRSACGYGYQFWVTDEGFSMYGMGSQYAFFYPSKDMLFVCTGDTQVAKDDFCGELLYDWVTDVYEQASDALKESVSAVRALETAEQNFSMPRGSGERSEFEDEINGVRYDLSPNAMNIEYIKFTFDNKGGEFAYENARGKKKIEFAFGDYLKGTFPEVNFYCAKVGEPSNRQQNCAATAQWVEKKKLLIRVYVTDSNLGNLFITASFKDDYVTLLMKKKAEFFMWDYEGSAYGRRGT